MHTEIESLLTVGENERPENASKQTAAECTDYSASIQLLFNTVITVNVCIDTLLFVNVLNNFEKTKKRLVLSHKPKWGTLDYRLKQSHSLHCIANSVCDLYF